MNLRSFRVWMGALVFAGLSALTQPPRTAAQDDDELDFEDESQPSEAEQSEAAGEATHEATEPEGEAGVVGADADPAGLGRTLRARAFFGGGFGSREMRRPIRGGTQRLEPVYFAAADVGISARLWPEDTFSLEVQVRYLTSLGLVIQEQPLVALVNRVDVRSEHAELSFAPRFRLGNTANGARLAFPIGASMRNFWPAVHQLLTPRYTLVGPHVRAELDMPIGESVRVRVGPELQVFAIVGTDLIDHGVRSPVIGLGGEAGVQFKLSDHLSLDLELRQSWARASSETERSFVDIERFVTVRLAGEM